MEISADQTAINAGECTIIRVTVEGVAAAWLDGVPIIGGQAEKTVCPCATMNRIDPPHLLWVLENLLEGNLVNVVEVPETVKHYAKVALERMLSLPGTGPGPRGQLARD